MKLVLVAVDAAGKVTITTQGFTGTDCLDATKALKAALGGQVVSEVKTAEGLASSTTAQPERAR